MTHDVLCETHPDGDCTYALALGVAGAIERLKERFLAEPDDVVDGAAVGARSVAAKDGRGRLRGGVAADTRVPLGDPRGTRGPQGTLA